MDLIRHFDAFKKEPFEKVLPDSILFTWDWSVILSIKHLKNLVILQQFRIHYSYFETVYCFVSWWFQQ